MKLKIFIFVLLLFIVTFIFSEVIIMKDDRVIDGKIIKMDEDTITVITKTKEIIIDKEDVLKIYYNERDYEEDKAKNNRKETFDNKDDNEVPYIVKTDPPNGAKNVLASRCKVWAITFNEPMQGSGFNMYFTHKIEQIKARWVNQKIYQITFNEELRSDTEYKIVLNKTNERRSDIQNMNGIFLKNDTVVVFTTASKEMEDKFLKIQDKAANGVNVDINKYAWLGINSEDLNNKIKKELNIKSLIRGVIVKKIIANSPAEVAELEVNDIIQNIFDEKIYTKEYFDFYINNLYFGSKIKLKIYRNGEEIEKEIVLNISK